MSSTTPSATRKSASLARLQVENGRSCSAGLDLAIFLISRRWPRVNFGAWPPRYLGYSELNPSVEVADHIADPVLAGEGVLEAAAREPIIPAAGKRTHPGDQHPASAKRPAPRGPLLTLKQRGVRYGRRRGRRQAHERLARSGGSGLFAAGSQLTATCASVAVWPGVVAAGIIASPGTIPEGRMAAVVDGSTAVNRSARLRG